MLAWSTFKLATRVVLVTVNGAVPVAIEDTICPAVPKLPTLAFPEILYVPFATTPVLVAVHLAVVFPVTYSETFPFAVIVTLLFPFCNNPLLIVVMLPVVMIAVAVPKLPTLALPLTFAVPVIFAPVSLMTIVLLLLAVNVMFAFCVIAMLLLPFA